MNPLSRRCPQRSLPCPLLPASALRPPSAAVSAAASARSRTVSAGNLLWPMEDSVFPACPPDVLLAAARDGDAWHRYCAALNPACPAPLLAALIADPDPLVSAAASDNPNRPVVARRP